MKQRVLITGASGFVGYHLIEAALNKGLEVFAAVRKTSNVAHLSSLNIHYTYLDFTNITTLEREIREQQYTYIIHAAGTTKAKNQEEYNRVNAEYTSNLAKAAANTGVVKKMVFISSLAATGPLKDCSNNIVEGILETPVTAYGVSKLLAEKMLKEIDLPVVVLRPTAVYGPRDKELFIILKTFAQGFEPYIGKMDQQLSFVYVKDLSALSVNALYTGDTANGIYNITDGNCYNRYQLANTTKSVLQKKTLKLHIPLIVVKALASILETTYGWFSKTPTLNVEKLNELIAVNWCCNIEKASAKFTL